MSDISKTRAGTAVLAEENSNGTTAPAASMAIPDGNGTAPTGAAANGNGAAAHVDVAGSTASDTATPRRADQDQEIAAVISSTGKTIKIALNDADISKVLAKRGFKKEKLNAGLDLCATAQEKWDARQAAIARQAECTGAVNRLFGEAVKAYGDFREAARAELDEAASLKALSVSDVVPDDLDKFLTHARGAYNCAKEEPYVTALGDYGYDEEGLDDELKALEDLDKANQEQSQAMADAQKATRLRDDAAKPVRNFRNKLRRIARRAFRTDPEQARKLEI